MSAEETEIRLTVYALADPGLTDAERAEVAREVAADPKLQRQVAEVQSLAKLLTAGLAAEVAATPSLAVPSSVVPKRQTPNRWLPAAIALLAVVGVGLTMLPGVQKQREAALDVAAPAPATEPEAINGRGMAAVSKMAVEGDKREQAAPQGQECKGATESLALDARPQLNWGEMAKPGTMPAPVPGALKPGDAALARGQGIGGFGGIQGGFGGGSGGLGAGTGGFGGSQGFGGGSGGFGGGGAPGVAAPAPLPSPQPMSGAVPGRFGDAPGGFPTPEPVPAVLAEQTKDFAKANHANVSDQLKQRNSQQLREYAYGRQYRGREVLARDAKPLPDPQPVPGVRWAPPVHPSGDQFPASVENPFVTVAGADALSTFGVDVDTASYTIARNFLKRGTLPPPDSVRLEDFVNYFRYQDKPPTGDDPFAVTVEVAECPWQPGHKLARIGLKAKPIDDGKRPPSNLVFLVDVSGSMDQPNKLPLVVESLKLLVNQLGENDRVAMVVYAGAAGMVLDSTSAANKVQILAALDKLRAGGSTNGAGGIQQAYELAQKHFIQNGINRVILCTDGDFNVGTTSTEALVSLIEQKRKTGVFLSVFGFGMGNLRDEMMVKLAGKGNGNYGYIDTLREAHKALVEQMGGTLVTVAKDVKIQVEFNPATVKAYRLLGYEKRILATQDFADDKKDAGEMGAGHTVTALYELVPAGEQSPANPAKNLRYQPKPAPVAVAPKPVEKPNEAFVVKMRHKKPDGDTSVLRELPVANANKSIKAASEDFRFSAAAAEFALILRDSPYKGSATLAATQNLATGAMTHDPSGYRAEFIELLRQAQRLAPGK